METPFSSKELLALQVQAFLNAAEDVDVEPETIEDLLDTLTAQEQEKEAQPEAGNIDTVDVQSKNSAPEPPRTILDITGDDNSSDDPDYVDDGPEDDEIDISSLYAAPQEQGITFSKQELRAMLHYLKERGMSAWVKEYVVTRAIPIPSLLEAFGIRLCPELRAKKPMTLLFFLRVALSRELRMRERLPQYNTIDDAANLIKGAQRIMILTGAGISVSCGIPDFRSSTGLYANLKERGEYELDDPQEMFDIHYFRENPAVFYSFAHEIYPSKFVPSPCHRFIKLVEDKGKLLRNYTQNIDTLETLAGVKRVLNCHGSFATASCIQCRRRVPGTDVEEAILSKKVPVCSVCCPPESLAPKKKKKSKKKAEGKWDSQDEDESDGPVFPTGIMKPDITFFGEKLTDDFDDALREDRDKVDLLIIIGTSLKVSPVADLIMHLPHSVPQILINKQPVRHINPDIVLLGDADRIVEHLCSVLGWSLPEPATRESGSATLTLPEAPSMKKRPSSDMLETPPTRVGNSHVWLFEGAEGGRWVEALKAEEETAAAQAASSSSVDANTPAAKLEDGTSTPAKRQRTE
ncbi:SIR2-domain-containing protein [Schizophyllum commune H4-8]|nr:SIR2-domain-containing protein [Schizophyllum commune H4-8]KAI5895119.1 SIR2-domain-containing protein [Schizophyllum commune H4-8]